MSVSRQTETGGKEMDTQTKGVKLTFSWPGDDEIRTIWCESAGQAKSFVKRNNIPWHRISKA